VAASQGWNERTKAIYATNEWVAPGRVQEKSQVSNARPGPPTYSWSGQKSAAVALLIIDWIWRLAGC
jgi:hypothetical protein